jgi:glyoxylase-like metal-dependent hydrolase (beta-lactamase superfamily II)
MIPQYEVYAIKYAGVTKKESDNFIYNDHHDVDMDLDFFIWVIKHQDKIWLVDLGFGEEEAQRRNRKLIYKIDDALKLIDIDHTAIENVIITHMHFDHVGNLEYFPKAKFYLQDAEMSFATGRNMCHSCLSHPFNVKDVIQMVQNVYKNRVVFIDGIKEIAPGISLHKVGGHTGGLQVVRVHTERGWVVLASDASHFYRNKLEKNPYPIVFNIGEMMEGFNLLDELASSADHIIPGHDPDVLTHYPHPNLKLALFVAVLHKEPLL